MPQTYTHRRTGSQMEKLAFNFFNFLWAARSHTVTVEAVVTLNQRHRTVDLSVCRRRWWLKEETVGIPFSEALHSPWVDMRTSLLLLRWAWALLAALAVRSGKSSKLESKTFPLANVCDTKVLVFSMFSPALLKRILGRFKMHVFAPHLVLRCI